MGALVCTDTVFGAVVAGGADVDVMPLAHRRHRPPRGWLPVEPERQALVASQLFPETPAHSSIGDSQELPWAPGAAARQHGDIASISTATSHQLQLSELEL